ncbi:hypothetical protein PPACK8108_LOCUS2665 [Phakopsora pachyrhizi]|uniref:Uncharacterized protein n=1 Tax=Phakopsora pachyrhizi TaxID=170000 RepID=A0AAV0AK02_PHAPC|nr:hypothetical protein PPACK8108_LOCUS2665 [Phakopsora pachyrhizi]
MGPMYYVLNLKWLQLSNVLILGSIVHINRGSLELIESSSLNSVTRNFKMNDPSPRLNNIVIPGFGDAALEIPSKELKTQESTISFLRIPKFDLNELPQDMDSGMIHSDDVENSKVESERYYKLALKWRQMEPDHQSLSPTNSQSPIVNLGSEHKFVTSNKAQTINEPEISRDVRNWQPEINFNQKEGKKHSPKIFEENLSGPSKRDSTEYETSNNRKRKKSDLIEDRISSSESKRENKVDSAKKTESKINNYLTTEFTKGFIKFLTVKVENFGPFAIEGKLLHYSPYNKNLLNFIENNLENILPEELDEYTISTGFFQLTKSIFWNQNEGIFFLSEERLSNAMNFVDSKSHSARGKTWVRHSRKSFNSLKSLPATVIFCFRKVFTNFFTYEKLSSFFFTENMRKRGKIYFENLNLNLVELAKGNRNISKVAIDNILRLIWIRLTSFLAYVHAINAIISPGPLKPLSYEQLVKKQEDALDFFFRLHDKAENLFTTKKIRRSKNVYLNPCSNNLNVEEKKQQVIKTIFDSTLHNDNASWLYVELWMMIYRPNLLSIMKNDSKSETKFKSLLNRVFLILFSGMATYTKLNKSKKPMEILNKMNTMEIIDYLVKF